MTTSEPATIQWKHVSCPLCAADRPVPVVTDRVRVSGVAQAFHVVRCRTCGMVYVNPRGVSVALGNTEGGAARRDAAVANLPFYEGGMAALRRAGLRPGARLLDVGCARGDFLAYASARGYAVTGVDLNPRFAAEARARGYKVITGDLRDSVAAGSADAVTMWDVIEHVDSPVEVLRACGEALAPGGLVFFHTGNARFQIPKARFLSWVRSHGGPYLIPQQHLTHFDPRTAYAALEAAGLQPVSAFFAGTMHYRQGWKRLAMGAVNALGRIPPLVGGPLLTSSMGVIGRSPQRRV